MKKIELTDKTWWDNRNGGTILWVELRELGNGDWAVEHSTNSPYWMCPFCGQFEDANGEHDCGMDSHRIIPASDFPQQFEYYKEHWHDGYKEWDE